MVIDLIGNYRNADIILRVIDITIKELRSPLRPMFLLHCEIILDKRIIYLPEEMTLKKQPRKETLLQAYEDL